MSTYSASKAIAIPQSAEEGAAFAGRRLSLSGIISGERNRCACKHRLGRVRAVMPVVG